KVKEAKDAKLDTSASFIKELEGYRKQLVKPYLVIEEVNEQAIRDAYERMKTNVRARHILFRLAENASPKDTLAVYEKAQEVRNQILSGKLTFVQAALQYSEDPSVRDMDMGEGRPVRPGNKGDLGYFGVFDMVYPFEEATFNLDLNEISAPTRTRFGYHLIQLTDKIPAIGQVKAAHIFIQKSNPNSPIDSAKVRIDELYNQLQNGVPFEKVALESDDKGSSAQGGELPLFTANRMVPQFIEAISKLKIGEVSVPVQTSFGWHIIKFIEQKPIDSFDKVKEDIEEKLKRDIRSKKGEQAKIAQIKVEENYREYPEALLELVEVVDSNFYAKDFEITSLRKYSKPVLTLRDETTTQFDFLKYLFENRAS
ncbi:MAG: peptidylprolyl isomerase, partial [Bacteroidales bacterium]|nr:peptidylprolyl isomerase [Bacteroidales bacterium]